MIEVKVDDNTIDDSISTDEEIENIISDTFDDNMMSVGGSNYLSSSAHSSTIHSDSNKDSNISINNKKNKNKLAKHKSRRLSDSINTSDINMISIEE